MKLKVSMIIVILGLIISFGCGVKNKAAAKKSDSISPSRIAVLAANGYTVVSSSSQATKFYFGSKIFSSVEIAPNGSVTLVKKGKTSQGEFVTNGQGAFFITSSQSNQSIYFVEYNDGSISLFEPGVTADRENLASNINNNNTNFYDISEPATQSASNDDEYIDYYNYNNIYDI